MDSGTDEVSKPRNGTFVYLWTCRRFQVERRSPPAVRFVRTSRLSLIVFLDYSRSRWNGTTWTNFCGITALSRSTLPIQCRTRTFLVRGWLFFNLKKNFFLSKVKTVYLLKKMTISLSLKKQQLAIGSKRVPANLLNASCCETFQIWFCWTKSLPLRCGRRWGRCWPTPRDARRSSRSSLSPTTNSSESNVRTVVEFYFCVANDFKISRENNKEQQRFIDYTAQCGLVCQPQLDLVKVQRSWVWLTNHSGFLNK